MSVNSISKLPDQRFFSSSLQSTDPDVHRAIVDEHGRQQNEIELIASENIVSAAVIEAQGSVMTNKYAEGYPGRRYYGGCQHVDVAEEIARERAKQLFDCKYVNVQPHSGAQANQAVFFALLEPGDTYMGLDLAAGGHLTHGSPVNQSGKWFNAISYGVDRDSHRIDFDEVQTLARQHKPKLLIAGGSAYPRAIDFARFRDIADEVGAVFMVDMAHFAGLVAGQVHANPLHYADVVTTTTHKTLRGPRGGMILSNDVVLGKKFNSSVFPGLQGGPLMHVIAAKAVAFGEALLPSFKVYSQQVIDNAQTLANTLRAGGLDLVSDGTDTHLLLVNLQSIGLTGIIAEQALSRAGITCNKNGIPFDVETPFVTSGIRLGTPAGTTRGFNTKEFEMIGQCILKVLNGITEHGEAGNMQMEQDVLEAVTQLSGQFPIYPFD